LVHILQSRLSGRIYIKSWAVVDAILGDIFPQFFCSGTGVLPEGEEEYTIFAAAAA